MKQIQPTIYFLLSVIFLAILKIFHPLTPLYELLIVYAVVSFFPKYKIEAIGTASVIYFVFFMNRYETFKYGTLVHTYADNLQIPEKLISLLIFFTTYWFLKKIIILANTRIKINTSFLGIIIIPFAGALTYEVLRLLSLPINHFLAPLMIAKSVWFFIIYLKQKEDSTSRFKKIFHFFHLLPPLFFQRYEARESFDLKKYVVQNQKEKTEHSKFGFYFVTRGVFTILFFEYIGRHILGYLHVEPEKYRYFNDFVLDLNLIYQDLPTRQLWLVLVFSCVDFLFTSYYGYFSLFVGVCRVFGVKISSPTNEPWKAQSFGDFCWRFMYFYSFILMNYFYIPFLNLVSKFKLPHQHRKNICLFFAISIGGFYFHFMNDFYYCYDKGYVKTFTYYIQNYMPLFALWALVIVLNVNIKCKIKYRFFAFPTYIIMYTLISTFRLLFKFDNLGAFLNMYVKLFNLN